MTREKARTVSIRASREYVQALNELARRHNMKTADFVRQTFDDLYEEDLEPMVNFFANGDYVDSQKLSKNIGAKQ